jgi:hypothetical protein
MPYCPNNRLKFAVFGFEQTLLGIQSCSVNFVRKPYQLREARVGYSGKTGICIHCGQPATKEALFRNGSAVIVEKYCDSCLQDERFSAIMTFYAMNKN